MDLQLAQNNNNPKWGYDFMKMIRAEYISQLAEQMVAHGDRPGTDGYRQLEEYILGHVCYFTTFLHPFSLGLCVSFGKLLRELLITVHIPPSFPSQRRVVPLHVSTCAKWGLEGIIVMTVVHYMTCIQQDDGPLDTWHTTLLLIHS